MSEVETKTVVVEREFAHPPERLWRALTQPHLMAEWLMQTDFAPTVGHRFDFHQQWGSIACEVLEVEPLKTLAYSWVALGLDSTVTWTLTPTDGGTHLRMEQEGFRTDQKQELGGARFGWTKFFGNLEEMLARPETDRAEGEDK